MTSDSAVQAARVVQVLLVLGAVLTGLSMAEQTAAVRNVGEESLSVGVEAPVENPRGPWEDGQVLTEADAGIPVDVAPRWNVTARHATDAVPAAGHDWSAELEIRERGDEGRDWWSVEEDLPVEAEGASIRIPLDANATLERARQLDDEAGVAGRLQVRVVVRHTGDVTVDGETRRSGALATLQLIPEDDRFVVQTSDGGTTYSETVEREISPMPFALAAAAVAVEAVPAWARRHRDPWEEPAVDTVLVDGLTVPGDAARSSLEDLLETARDRDVVVLVDVDADVAFVAEPAPIWARLGQEGFREVGSSDEVRDVEDYVRR